MSEHRDKDFGLPPNPFVARDGITDGDILLIAKRGAQ